MPESRSPCCRAGAFVVTVLAIVAAACCGAGPKGARALNVRPASGQPECLAAEGPLPSMRLTAVATGFDLPLLALRAPGDASRLYVVEQKGRVRIATPEAVQPAAFLDISAKVRSGGERGLLGLAFHPQYATNGRFFVDYTDLNGNTVVAEYRRSADPTRAEPEAVGLVLTQKQPEANHNGGAIAFGPIDGMLYVALGDGGGAGDRHGTIGNGQRRDTFLGKILRVDVTKLPYRIPPGSFNGDGFLPEIWDYGLRNPWRLGFDLCTGELYIGDVGQNAWEEIDVEPALSGQRNYGWRLREGFACFNPPANCDPGGATTLPAVVYPTGSDCAVIGGHVYRGARMPGLRGRYFYGDFCSGRIWSFLWQNGAASAPIEHTEDLGSAGTSIASFGQDLDGEIYVVDYAGTLLRIDPD